jgi:NlpC/P60 family putative phage cell wall peptidase
MKSQKKQTIAQARTWIGTPFHHQARLKNKGCDCLGLIVGVVEELDLKDKYGQPLACADEATYSREPDGSYLMKRLADLLHEVPAVDAKAGDLALFSMSGNPQHMAFLSDYDGMLGMIHSYAQARRVVEHRLDKEWKQRLVKVFRL